MPAPPRPPGKRQRTRDRLAQVAFDLFETHGYEAVTMDQIARTADVSRGTLYNHFAVKEAVLVHWMHGQLARDLAPLMDAALAQATFRDRVSVVFAASADWWERHRQYLAPYVRHRFQSVGAGPASANGESSSDLVPLHARLIGQAQDAGELRRDAAPGRLALYLHYLYLCALMRWLAEPALPLADEFAQALQFFLQGAATRDA